MGNEFMEPFSCYYSKWSILFCAEKSVKHRNKRWRWTWFWFFSLFQRFARNPNQFGNPSRQQGRDFFDSCKVIEIEKTACAPDVAQAVLHWINCIILRESGRSRFYWPVGFHRRRGQPAKHQPPTTCLIPTHHYQRHGPPNSRNWMGRSPILPSSQWDGRQRFRICCVWRPPEVPPNWRWYGLRFRSACSSGSRGRAGKFPDNPALANPKVRSVPDTLEGRQKGLAVPWFPRNMSIG